MYVNERSTDRCRSFSLVASVAMLLTAFDARADTPPEDAEGVPPRLVAIVGPHYTAFSLSSLQAFGLGEITTLGSHGLAGLDLRVGAELLDGDLCLLMDLVVGFTTGERTTTSTSVTSETETTPAEITTSTFGVQYTTTLWQIGLSGRWNARRPRPETMVPFIGGRAYYEYSSTSEDEQSGGTTLDVDSELWNPTSHGFGVQLSMGLEYLFNRHLGLGVEGMLGYGVRFHEDIKRRLDPETTGFSFDPERRSEEITTRTEHGLSWRTILTLSFRL